MVQMDNPFHFWCLGRMLASPRNVWFLVFEWMGGLHHLPPIVFQKNVPRVLYRAFYLKLALPLGLERSHVSLAYASLETCHNYPETFHTYPRAYSMHGCCCGCGGMGIGCSLPPNLVSLYSVPACGWPLTPAGEPLWPIGGPHHVSLLSFGTLSRIPVGGWARDSHIIPHWSSSSMVVPPYLCKQLLRKDRISQIASSLCWGLQGGGLGDLHSKYTSW